MFYEDDVIHVFKEQALCLLEGHVLVMHCTIWLQLCIANILQPTIMVVQKALLVLLLIQQSSE